MHIDDKIKLCRIVGVMLFTDGVLQDEEVEHMGKLMDRLGLDEDQKHDVMDRLESGTEVMEDVRDLRQHGRTLLDELRKASDSDGEVAPEEADLMKMIGDVLEDENESILAD